MSEKNIKSRIVHKHDLESNWLLATGFTPKQGEIIVYDVDENYSYERFKIGDGIQNVNDLPFINSVADWNQNDETALDYVKNRTHWAENLDIEWDGTIGDRYCVSDSEGSSVKLVKMSDYLPQRELLHNHNVTHLISFFGDHMVNEDTAPVDHGDAVRIGNVYVVYAVPYTNWGFTIEETGIYFESGITYVSKFYVEDVIVHKINEKYIPDSAFIVSDWNQNDETALDYIKNRTHWAEHVDIEWDGEIGDRYCAVNSGTSSANYVKVSDYLPSRELLRNITVGQTIRGRVRTSKNPALTDHGNAVQTTPTLFVVYNAPWINGDYTFGETGVYFSSNSSSSYTSLLHVEDATIHQIPQKFIPNADWSTNDSSANGYITNRTHYKYIVETPLDIRYNGDSSNLVSFGEYKKISDRIFTIDELSEMYYERTYSSTGTSSVADVPSLTLSEDETRVQAGMLIQSIKDTSKGAGAQFPETGLYVWDALGSYISRIYSDTVMSENVVYKKLDLEYLPEHIHTELQSDVDGLKTLVGETAVTDQINTVTADVIRHSVQDLTNEQKAQARVNIGAGVPIIDVTELPTENIDEKSWYRLITAKFLEGRMHADLYTVYCVETLPEVGKPASNLEMTDGNIYYVVGTGDVYGYVDETLSAGLSVPVGWYHGATLLGAFGNEYGGIVTSIDGISEDDNKYRILVEYTHYSYKNNWNAIDIIGWRGTGEHAEIFNGFNNIASGYYSHAEGYVTKASGSYSHAEGYKTTAEGGFSHAEGSFSNAEGERSHAEGNSSRTSGVASHAEGKQTHAQGKYSHTEGLISHAQGESSHAEGYGSYVEGDYSHAEGYYTYACGKSSHAEGYYTYAYGDYSHAEGCGRYYYLTINGEANATTYTVINTIGINDLNESIIGNSIVFTENNGAITYHVAEIVSVDKDSLTITLDKTLSSDTSLNNEQVRGYISGIALGDNSHSEGYHTIAAGRSQHVQGENNIIDPEYDANDSTKRGKYAHIVGNGESYRNRSNAHTLDWEGNAWFQGDIYTGGVGQNDEVAKKIATEEYVTEQISSSVADWNQNDSEAVDYVKNRTHYEETTQVPLNIQWDGSTAGRDSISLFGLTVVKVSDLILSDEELKQCFLKTNIDSEFIPISDATDEEWMYFGESTFVLAVAVARNTTDNLNPDPSGEPIYAPSTGIYLLTTEDGYIDRLYSETVTMTGTIVHKIPEKYLPEVTHWTDRAIDIEWNGQYAGRPQAYSSGNDMMFVKISDDIPSDEAMKNATMSIKNFDGTEFNDIELSLVRSQSNEDASAFGNDVDGAFVVVVRKPMTLVNVLASDGVIFEETGIYVMLIAGENGGYVSKLHVNEYVHKIPVKYLPDSVPYEEATEDLLDVQWDGAPDGRDTFDYHGIKFVKVSDLIISDVELEQCTIQTSLGELYNLTGLKSEWSNHGESTYAYVFAMIRNTTDNLNSNSNADPFYAPSTGIYFMYSSEAEYVNRLCSNSITIQKTIVHKIPVKYLPDSVPYKEEPVETVILSETTVGSDMVNIPFIGLVEGGTYCVTFNGIKYECIASKESFVVEQGIMHGIALGNKALTGFGENTGETFLLGDAFTLVDSTGTVHVVNAGMVASAGGTISIVRINQDIHKIPEEYLPEKTHWTETIEVPLDIKLPDDASCLPSLSEQGNRVFVKVSDLVLTEEELLKCSVSYKSITEDGEITGFPYYIVEDYEGCLYARISNNSDGSGVSIPAVCVVYDINHEMAIHGTGIYFTYCESLNMRTTRLYSDEVMMHGVKYHTIAEDYLPEKVLANANFEQTDPNGAGYIEGLDRTEVRGNILYEYTKDNMWGGMLYDVPFVFVKGDKYIVTLDGTEYESEVHRYSVGNVYVDYLGNGFLQGIPSAQDTGEPFWFSIANSIMDTTFGDITWNTITFRKIEVETKIPDKYLNIVEQSVDVKDIEWDGEIGDKYNIIDWNELLGLVKLSDYSPTIDNMTDIYISVVDDEIETTERASISDELSTDGITVIVNESAKHFVAIVHKPNAEFYDFVLEETGIYFLTDGLMKSYVSKFHFKDTETKIAAKYLPDCVPSIPVPTTATVGQLLAVKAVDENGKPTEWGLVTISLTTDENGVMKITMT